MRQMGNRAYVRKIKSIIKLSILIVSIFGATAASATDGKLQDVLEKTISIEFKDVLLKDALDKISAQTKISFVYVSNPALNNKVSVQAHDQKVGELLKKLLLPYALQYVVVDDHIVIRAGTEKPGKVALEQS